MPRPADAVSRKPAVRLFALLQLDRAYVLGELIPLLCERHFAGDLESRYTIRIQSASHPRQMVYSNSSNYPPANNAADAAIRFFSIRFDQTERPFPDPFRRNPIMRNSGNVPEPTDRRFSGWRMRPPGGPAGGPGFGLWELRLEPKNDSLDAAVSRQRYRNLLVSFGILLLLSVSVVLLLVSVRRSQRLADLQMEFIAGITHEFRTPLAVICSAGDNLADGVVDAPAQVARYGTLIRSEGRRLSAMVEQVLEFAGIQSGHKRYELRAVAVGPILEEALAACQLSAGNAGFQVETSISSNLPLVMADPNALRHSIQNLLSNAMKYGGTSGWIGLRAASEEANPDREVQITVEDHGAGIDAEELPHIFEPFFRGKHFKAAQIHGNGLGLSLVKNIMHEHEGKVSVVSTPGQGSAFTLHLRAVS